MPFDVFFFPPRDNFRNFLVIKLILFNSAKLSHYMYIVTETRICKMYKRLKSLLIRRTLFRKYFNLEIIWFATSEFFFFFYVFTAASIVGMQIHSAALYTNANAHLIDKRFEGCSAISELPLPGRNQTTANH